ncbi:gamma-glutamyltransferase [Falsiroseomonas oryziterrae]|uniref:gamma-glutamyltransferase n=1 Tax=Falsiroseomonas oryziterrae TaxID=2911368 RepID=UPI001F39806A|nr:gamma-glutamyltransferase [Roseomonas sp. NPKOSM-4]
MPLTYTPPPHTTQHWHVAKPAARGRRGVVASQSRAAAEAGLAILDAGGNAADAAVAMAFALATTEPWNSGLGGIGFAQVAGPGIPARTLDFGPVSPGRLDPAAFPMTGRMKQDLFAWPEVEGDRNIHGPLSFAIPSAVAGYAALHEAHGKLPIADVLAPAVALAKRGLAQDWFTTLKVANAASTLRLYPESARIYLPGGLPPVAPYQGTPGFFRLGALPDTLERLARAGLRDFYEGEVAQAIAADVAAMGGVLSAEDLAQCRARILPAVSVPWRGRTLHLSNGLTATPTFRRVAALMEEADWSGHAPGPAWHLAFARAMQLAYVERLEGLGETEKGSDTCTTHLTVCDAGGMMVAMTTTLLSSMGSRVVLPRSGVLMNNGVMWFDPRPGTPNAIGPNKRPLCNMSPVIATDAAGVPAIALGASGGRRILAAVFQMLAMTAAFGMDPEAAAHAPRIDVSGPEGLTADRRLPAATLEALQDAGPVELVEHAVLPVNFACPNLIAIGPDGARTGITDLMSPWSAALAQQ